MYQVNENKLGGKARETIDQYLNLPIGARPSCPYFNNRRRKTKSALRVLLGKGTPMEIVEECTINSLHSRININSLKNEEIKKFLIDHDLGIDCSGFAYHVLNSLTHELTKKNLPHFITSLRKGLFGSIIFRLRPAENIGVATFASEKNSKKINVSEAKPGDMIIFLGTGKEKTYNHVLLITEVEKNNKEIILTYAHSYSWPEDGIYHNGVREGKINLHNNDILKGVWTEKNKTGPDNYTFESAKEAKEVFIKRLNFLS